MTAIILKEQREQLLTQGYCIIPDVLDPSMLHKIRQVTEGLLAQQSAEDTKRERSTGSMISISVDPVFAELIALPKDLEKMASLGYANPKFTSGFVISKPPQSPRLFWHYDIIGVTTTCPCTTRRLHLGIFQSGKRWVDEHLFNGEYYMQHVDLRYNSLLIDLMKRRLKLIGMRS
ncbi:hypothetical protein SAMN04487897_11256 [Paenibacillus sp. yr247]|uniref:hypothetical protein n=1 Tax=Paenibacillus sp. yr247 TaxID=1761880 RepID=UPI00088BE6AB|nr:hypothetical protein [Paenibacillus sp. yr247]SDO33815.1 hypothetical protein SAMN04487897_11256 [Paenibacillus sp. yr247]